MDHTQVPPFPEATMRVFHDQAAEVTVNGVATPVSGSDLRDTRANAIRVVAVAAERLGRPVRARALDEQDEWPLIVYPDALVESDSTAEPGKRSGGRKPSPAAQHPTGGRSAEAVSEHAGGRLPSDGEGQEEPSGVPDNPPSPDGPTVRLGPDPIAAAEAPPPPVEPVADTALPPTAYPEPVPPPVPAPQWNSGPRTAPAPHVSQWPVPAPQAAVEAPPHRPDTRGANLASPQEAAGKRRSSRLFGAIKRRGKKKGEEPAGPERQGASEGLTRDESGQVWSSVIEEINRERRYAPPFPGPPAGPPPPPPAPATDWGWGTGPMPAPPAPGPAPGPTGPMPPVHAPGPRSPVPPAAPSAPGPPPGPPPGPAPGPAPWSGPSGPQAAPMPMGEEGRTGSGVTAVFQRHGNASEPVPQAPLPSIPAVGAHTRIAVLSLKGGVGKTTTAVLLGSVFASVSENRTVAVDMNPHGGTLLDRVPLQSPHTLRDLHENSGTVTRYADVRRYVSENGAGMHALLGDPGQDSELLERRGAYPKVAGVLERYYDIALTDCGTGLGQPGMGDVLGLAHRVVIVSQPALDSARAAVATLEWLSANGYPGLASTALVALSRVDPRVVSAAELDGLERFFQGRAAGVVRVPFDEHLARGGIVDLGALRPETRAASHRLATLSAGL
ncbi:hypothetical protein [Nocardiopsis sp. LOL_012]|uniref:nucleotide-binding protein n=1 Tax=Nocardiopsis sp. LOL_012 TaxID=3345409 RepID=UPI003A86EEFF